MYSQGDGFNAKQRDDGQEDLLKAVSAQYGNAPQAKVKLQDSYIDVSVAAKDAPAAKSRGGLLRRPSLVVCALSAIVWVALTAFIFCDGANAMMCNDYEIAALIILEVASGLVALVSLWLVIYRW